MLNAIRKDQRWWWPINWSHLQIAHLSITDQLFYENFLKKMRTHLKCGIELNHTKCQRVWFSTKRWNLTTQLEYKVKERQAKQNIFIQCISKSSKRNPSRQNMKQIIKIVYSSSRFHRARHFHVKKCWMNRYKIVRETNETKAKRSKSKLKTNCTQRAPINFLLNSPFYLSFLYRFKSVSAHFGHSLITMPGLVQFRSRCT